MGNTNGGDLKDKIEEINRKRKERNEENGHVKRKNEKNNESNKIMENGE
jgi:hypothetical protein